MEKSIEKVNPKLELETLLNSLNTTMDNILETRENELNQRQSRVEEYTKKAQEAKRNADKAFMDADESNLFKYNDEARKYETAIEMHKARVKALNDEPLITKKEYESYVSEVQKDNESLYLEYKKAVTSLLKEIINLAEEHEHFLNESNQTLYRLQDKLYRNADMEKNKYGEIINVGRKEVNKDCWSILRVSEQLKCNPTIQFIMKD